MEAAIGWLAPPQCLSCGAEGASLCVACSTSEIVNYGERCWHCGAVSAGGRTCPKCRPSSPRYVWITTNYEGIVKQLLGLYKFKHQRVAVYTIADLMAQTLLDFNNQTELLRTNYLIVPIPTATKRVRQRGFDHAALLAKTLSRKFDFEFAPVLGRFGQSRQLGAARHIRLKKPEGNYFVKSPKLVGGRNILLVDDVVTTGATLRAVTKQLRRAGARRIDALIFAKRL